MVGDAAVLAHRAGLAVREGEPDLARHTLARPEEFFTARARDPRRAHAAALIRRRHRVEVDAQPPRPASA
jgi:hypothetical protein